MSDAGSELVFVGSYGSPDQRRIHAVSVEASGDMAVVGGVSGIANPSFLAAHPHEDVLYAVSETGVSGDGLGGQVHSLRIERSEHEVRLAPMGSVSTRGDHPCHLMLDRSGRWLFATNYSSGEVIACPINEDGALEEPAASVRHVGRGPKRDRQDGPHPHSTIVSPDGRFVIVADLGLDQVIVYRLNETPGTLERHSVTRSRPGAGPRSSAFHPSGRFLGVVNELDNTLALFSWDSAAGTLDEVQVTSTLPGGNDVPNLAADVCFDQSGSMAFVSNRGHDSIMSYRFTVAEGLASSGFAASGGSTPRAMLLTAGGDRLLIANQESNVISALAVVGGKPDPVKPRTLSVEQPSAVVAARPRESTSEHAGAAG